MSEAETKPVLQFGYDARMGAMRLDLQYGNGQTLAYVVKIAEMLRQIPAYEMACYMEEAAQGPSPTRTIDELRLEGMNSVDWQDKTVLDVGGYMGEFAKMALDRGAKRAIVLDTEQWRHYGWEDKRLEGVEYSKGDMMDYWAGYDYITNDPDCLDPVANDLPRPDVLILYNVLYHVKGPWEFLKRAREIIRPDGTMLLCTLFRYHKGSWVYLYEPRECNPTDESVFWGFSLEALERLLTFTGWTFEQIGYNYDRVVYVCKPALEPQYRQSEA